MNKIKKIAAYILMGLLTALAVVGIAIMIYNVIFDTENITWP